MTIRICNYEIMSFTDSTILISEKGMSSIKSPPLAEALEELKPLIGKDIPESTLKKILKGKKIDAAEGLTFLDGTLNIIKRPKALPYEKIIIIHDHLETAFLKIIRSEVARETDIINAHDFSERTITQKRNFIVLMCENYDYPVLKALYYKIANSAPQSGIVVAHHMPDAYYFSQPFFAEIGNPCHFCHADRLLSYEEKKNSKCNWAQLLKFSKQRGVKIPRTNNNLSLLHESMIAGFLTSRIKLFTCNTGAKRHQDAALSSASINLITGKIEEEIVPHWTLCQCLRTVT